MYVDVCWIFILLSISEMLSLHVHIKVMVNLATTTQILYSSIIWSQIITCCHIHHAMLCAKHLAMFLLEIYFWFVQR